MGKKISIYLLACILLVIVIYPLSAQGQLPVVSNKGSTVTVPKVTGMLQKDAEAAIAKAGLEVANIIERETPFPAGKVVRQKPMPDTKVEKGSGVILVVSVGKAKNAEASASGVPQTIQTDAMTMTGMRIASQTISTGPLVMTGVRAASQTIITAPLQMTGMLTASQTITTSPLQMTGMRVNSITINTAPLKMTGMRP